MAMKNGPFKDVCTGTFPNEISMIVLVCQIIHRVSLTKIPKHEMISAYTGSKENCATKTEA